MPVNLTMMDLRRVLARKSTKRGDNYGSNGVLSMPIQLQLLLILALNYEIFSKKIKGCYFDIDGSEAGRRNCAKL